ncbi:vWA domain-containing protein [Gardnerella sp. Marseille-Q9179]|uniref:vWA domain-containing protein n=1 Tax=Gardnerella sp. Marseille-Q9179 TaxID=3383028 RepID=UPI003AF56376
MSNNVWEYIWPWRWQWPLLFVAGVVISVAIFAILLILDSIRSNILKKKYKSQASNITRKFYTFTFDNDLQGTTTSHSWYMWRMFRRFATAALVLSLCSALAVASRPARVFNANEQVSSRDIVLCLDVSGSALPYDREVIQAYLNFIEHFQGERIGLSIFNSTSRTVFPLTDDYRLAKKQLQYAANLLGGVQSQSRINRLQQRQYQEISDWLEGTQNRKNATSLIGDGLVSCAAMLPGFIYGSAHNNHKIQSRFNRSSSIVLATDNVVSGKQTYSLKQALDLTKQAKITVDGLYSGAKQNENDDATLEMKQLIESHGGIFLSQRNSDSVINLVKEIEKRHTAIPQGAAQSAFSDDPGLWVLLTVFSVVIWLAIAKRMKR